MRVSLWLFVLVLAGCLGSEQPCVDRPTDPLCQLADAGPTDAATDDAR